VKNRYHQPTDVYDMRWNFDGVTQNVKAFYALGEKLADSDTWPVWKDGSEFKAIREKSLATPAKKKK
jgi:cytochrome c556